MSACFAGSQSWKHTGLKSRHCCIMTVLVISFLYCSFLFFYLLTSRFSLFLCVCIHGSASHLCTSWPATAPRRLLCNWLLSAAGVLSELRRLLPISFCSISGRVRERLLLSFTACRASPSRWLCNLFWLVASWYILAFCVFVFFHIFFLAQPQVLAKCSSLADFLSA